MSVRNSSLVRGSSLNTPSMELVTVRLRGLLTPRIVIHMCLYPWKEEVRSNTDMGVCTQVILYQSGTSTKYNTWAEL